MADKKVYNLCYVIYGDVNIEAESKEDAEEMLKESSIDDRDLKDSISSALDCGNLEVTEVSEEKE